MAECVELRRALKEHRHLIVGIFDAARESLDAACVIIAFVAHVHARGRRSGRPDRIASELPGLFAAGEHLALLHGAYAAQ
jgi:hypothetical protein